MTTYIAVCIPKKLLTQLIAKSVRTVEIFLEAEIESVMKGHEEELKIICLEASSKDMATKILSWKQPDLYVLHVREENCIPE